MDQTPVSFEKIALPEHKEELESIGRETAERRVDYSSKGIEKEHKEVFREVLGEKIQERGGQPIVGGANARPAVSVQDDKAVMAEKTKKLQDLVNLAATKGPVEASLEAQKLGDPWIEDQFHDVLISFHDELIRRGKLRDE